MTTIDIGVAGYAPTINGSPGYTFLVMTNPAGGAGVLDSFTVRVPFNATGVLMGTFFDAGSPNYTPRDYETIGVVTAGADRTFSGYDCAVEAGDYIGGYSGTGGISGRNIVGGGRWRFTGNAFTGTKTFDSYVSNIDYILYAEGITVTAPGVKRSLTHMKMGLAL